MYPPGDGHRARRLNPASKARGEIVLKGTQNEFLQGNHIQVDLSLGFFFPIRTTSGAPATPHIPSQFCHRPLLPQPPPFLPLIPFSRLLADWLPLGPLIPLPLGSLFSALPSFPSTCLPPSPSPPTYTSFPILPLPYLPFVW